MPYQTYYCAASQWLTKSIAVPTHTHHRTDVANLRILTDGICDIFG